MRSSTSGGRAISPSAPVGWSDPEGRPVVVPAPPAGGSYYREICDFQGACYERNAFTRGTAQEVAFLVDALGLRPGDRLLDVGCGTGRHTRALAGHGLRALGVDLSDGLLRAGASSPGIAAFVQADARALPLAAGSVDAAISLCQGGFGITPGGDEQILRELRRVLRPRGRLALTAFSLAFAVRWLGEGEAFHVKQGLHHHRAEVRGPDAAARRFDLWTTTYSAAHLRLLAEHAGFTVDTIAGCEPGGYRDRPPTLADPELLLLATTR